MVEVSKIGWALKESRGVAIVDKTTIIVKTTILERTPNIDNIPTLYKMIILDKTIIVYKIINVNRMTKNMFQARCALLCANLIIIPHFN